MARIEPFRALRPRADLVDKVAAPPYDVLNSQEARELVAGNPYSFLHITKPEVDLPEDIDLYSDMVYAKAGENINRFISEGILRQDEQKMFYLYKQIWHDHVQVGLVACASAQDYQDDVIKKHELTREDKERDRMRHIDSINANTGPVFLTFKQNAEVEKLFDKAMTGSLEYDFTVDEVRHMFYVIRDSALVADIKEAFSRIPVLYVADGHHRSASATKIKMARQENSPGHSGDEEYNFFLSVIFPHNQMKIMSYNRVVHDLNGNGPEDFLKIIAEKFTVTPGDRKEPAHTRQFCMYLGKTWYTLDAKDGSFDAADPVASLDVSILQNNLLSPVLAIGNPRTDKRIDFVGGIRGTKELEKLVDSGKFAVAFSLYPTTIEQLFSVADAGKMMPPKSTWFEPKLKSGLAVHLLQD